MPSSILAVLFLALPPTSPPPAAPPPVRHPIAAAALRRIAAALDDPTIVAIFDEANGADIETAELAIQRGASKEVKAVGRRFKDDHTMVRQMGRDLAGKLGVVPTAPKPDQYAADHAAAMAKLSKLSGKEFDRAFLDHEIAFHAAVIEAVTKVLLPAIKNAELKALVEKVAPHFQSHLALAQATKTQLKM